MIVNAVKEGWEVIFQRAHEMLAVQIAANWKIEQRPEQWMETLVAIAEHDNQQESWNGTKHLTKAGAPIDFTMKPFSLQQARGITEVSQYKSRYVSLLISMHMSYLYEPLRGQKKEIDKFLDDQLQMQDNMRKSLGVKKVAAKKAYNIVQWCDRCSLILCKNELPKDEKKLEVFQDVDENMVFIWQRADKTVTVEPWCFEINEFNVRVEYRVLQQMQFSSDEELKKALLKAPVQEKHWVFRK